MTAAALTRDDVQQIADTVWSELLEFCKPDSCILATRVLGDVLNARGYGGRWRALSVRALVYNPDAARHVTYHGCTGTDDACQLMAPNGAIAVLGGRIGLPSVRPLSWGGHLVALVDRRWLVDLSLSQVRNPELGITLDTTAAVLDAPANFARTGQPVMGETDTDCRVVYYAQPNERSWETAPDWVVQGSLRAELGAAALARLDGRPYTYGPMIQLIRRLVGRV